MVLHGTLQAQSPNGSFVLVSDYPQSLREWPGGGLGRPGVNYYPVLNFLFLKVPFLICLQNLTQPKRRPSRVWTWPEWPLVYLTTDMLMCLGGGVIPDPRGGITVERVVYGPFYFSEVWNMMDSQTSVPRGAGKGPADRYSAVLWGMHFPFLWGVLVWPSSREKSAPWMGYDWQQGASECMCTEICFLFSWILP